MEDQEAYQTAVSFKFTSLTIVLVGYTLACFAYFYVLWRIKDRLLKTLLFLWVCFLICVLAQIGYCLCLFFPSYGLPETP
jgi:drug/metabolite transporter (DMT)-like permease